VLKIAEDEDLGMVEDEIYDDRPLEEAEESDEIDEVEEGFMKGYEEEGSMAECANCKKILTDEVVEQELDGELRRFCSEECAEKFEKKHNITQ